MNENGTKRREWVKNAAIVFLTVLLILTFFSNTIMNYSLPEVAAQYIQPGSITTKIRGTGTIDSDDPYNVEINETRKIESVLVRVGDLVQKGDAMFILADKESEELKAAEDALAAARLAFEKSILSGNVSNTVANNVQSGKTSSLAAYQAKIAAADAEIEKWQKNIDEIELAISQLTALQAQLSVSKPNTADAERKLNAAQAAYNADPVQIALVKVAEWEADKAEYEQVIDEYNKKIIVDWEKDVSGNDTIPVYSVSEKEYVTAVNNLATYEKLIAAQKNGILMDQSAIDANKKLADELVIAQQEYDNALNAISNSQSSVTVQMENWRLELSDKTKKLQDANTARSQLLLDIATELDLGSKKDEIEELEEKVKELKQAAAEAVIEAPISGTVASISLTAGQTTNPATPIATLQPEGSGFTMSFSVSTEQAKRLNPGMQAELVNAWRYDDVTVVLKRITPDPSNPSQQKILNFDVTGSVMAGQSLSVAVGDRSANYDMIVPNSAVREDNNGKFILIVETQSSPLGNRYRAVRMDVEVLASDDTQSAISGALEGWEFVITTSNKPVEAGQLVRLPD